MSASLDVSALVIRYGAIEAVRGISLRVAPGEVVALLGANGAGKSSVLNAISGLVPAASGHISYGDVRIDRLPPEKIVRLRISLTPEGRRVFSALTVLQNLRLGAIPVSNRQERQERQEYVLDIFPQLKARLNQPAGTLSGGEQQMLAIARSLMSRPTLLLLDELSLGLAPKVVEYVFSLLRRLHSEGLTMLLVEQEVRRALEIADRAYVLVHGQIKREEVAHELLATQDLTRLYLRG